jgi:RNA polymerase sigma factor (sigma-70 family)
MDEALDNWFKREVAVHDEALTRYLRRHWPHPADIYDLRQEAYVRIYESARTHIPTAARPFLFKIAQRLIADRIRKKRIVAIDSAGDLDALSVVVDDLSPERETAGHQELRQLAEALDGLPPKCREVVWLCRIDDLSRKEAAAHLGVSEKTIEKHLMKGMKRLIDAVFGESDGDRRQARNQDDGRECKKSRALARHTRKDDDADREDL